MCRPGSKEVKHLYDEHSCLDYRPIQAKLRKTQAASASTIYRALGQLELCQKRKQRNALVPSAPAPLVLEQLGLTIGLDFTHWDRKPICNMLEFESRYCPAAVASRSLTAAATTALDLAPQEAKRLGLPSQSIEVKSGHGSIFATPFRACLNQQTC